MVARETREIVTTGKPNKSTNPTKLNVLRGSAADFESLRADQVPEAGVEQMLFMLGKPNL